jgi:PTS system nitrogen regulatory IIA component
MIISDILDTKAILPELEDLSKEEVIEVLIELVCRVYKKVNGKEELVRVLLEREKLKSTGIEDGLAIPHGKHGRVKQMIGAFARSSKGIDFNALDGKPTHFFFLLLGPDAATSNHLKTLAHISRMFKDREFKDRLLATDDPIELYSLIIDQESRASR